LFSRLVWMAFGFTALLLCIVHYSLRA
jgi:hypothetical protein